MIHPRKCVPFLIRILRRNGLMEASLYNQVPLVATHFPPAEEYSQLQMEIKPHNLRRLSHYLIQKGPRFSLRIVI